MTLTPEEMAVYQAVTEWVASRFGDSHFALALAKIMPQRQAASCIPVMKAYLEDILRDRRIKAARADDGDLIDDASDRQDASLDESELRTVHRLLAVAEKVGKHDSKFESFNQALQALLKDQPDSKIVIFSFFKRTLEYLRRRLEANGITSAVIHGDVPRKDRNRKIRQFWSDRGLRVLLSSEVGGEGLDLQVANVIVNYDLPWNPMKVEQRIGRLDRYGQKHERIHIYNFSVKETIDDIILSRLYSRINIFEQYIGDLESILGNRVQELTRVMLDPEISHAERELKADQISKNLVREREAFESFERESERFIGQDEFFTREISQIRETKRFVTAEEVQFLLERFLASHCPSTTLRPPKSGRSEVFVLKSTDEFRAFMHSYGPNDPAARELQKQLNRDEGMVVTFSSRAACQDDDLMLITIHSPIIRAIVKFTEVGTASVVMPVGRLRLTGFRGLGGLYFLFVYLLEKIAAKRSLQLVPVLVSAENPDSFHIGDEVTERILGQLMECDELGNEVSIEIEDARRAEGVAEECVTMLREEEEGRLRRTNEVLINNRIESIRQARELKRRRIEDTIWKVQQSGGDQRILRLHEGRLRNLDQETESDLKGWEMRRQVRVAYRRVTTALIHFS